MTEEECRRRQEDRIAAASRELGFMDERPLPDPSSPEAPKYWMYETSGKLVPAVLAYLEGRRMPRERRRALRRPPAVSER